ncbi:MAG: hypothetical protein AMJ93_04795 [Anaerolineae bacterium SM23_84]|nr:MAG: hypothetical protein AMJ93_04795 [Anaerolineae bacterium SM23_84]
MFVPSVIVTLGAFALYLGLAVVTLAAGRLNPVRRTFAIYLLGMMAWSFSSFAARVGFLVDNALLWTKILICGSISAPIFFYHFVRAFLGFKRHVWRLYIGYALYIESVLITVLTPWAVVDAYVEGPRYYVELGPAMPFIAIWGAIYMILSISRLMQRYLEARDDQYRNKISYPLVGVTVVVLGSASNRIEALRVYPLDIAANAVNAMILAYSILRYQLINITPVLRRALTYALLIGALGGAYLVSFLALQRLTQQFGGVVLLLAFPLVLLVSLAFPALRRRGQLLVNRLLFHRSYALQQMLERLSSTAAEIIELQPLTQLILDDITATMQTGSASIFLRDAASGQFQIEAARNTEPTALEIRWRPDHPILRCLGTGQKALTRAQVDLEPESRALWAQERAELDHLGAEVFVPVQVKDDLVGVLAVGHKSSRDPYSADDMSALTALASQTAVAVENARLYATEQRRLKELLILLDIARAVGSTLDLTQVLKLIARRTAEACEVHRCSLFLLDEQRQHLLPLMSQFASGETNPELWEKYQYRTYVQRIEQVPVLKRVLEDRQPLVLGADSIDRLPDAWVRPFNICCLAIIPLIARGRVIGAMALDHVEPGQRFEQEQINLAMTIGSHTAAAIENASLYQQTAEEKARTETVLRETFGGMVLVNQDLRIVSINPGAELISGYSAEQVAGMPVGQVLGKEIEAPGSPLARARETGERVPPVGTMLSARQGNKDVLLGVTPLAGSGAFPVQYLLSFADISKLKEIDRLKSSIVANVSHELRTPLSSIKAYAELLLLGGDKGNEEVRQEWLSVIDREADRLTSFVNNLLDLSRLESERVELIREPLHLGELVADELVVLRVQAKQRDIGIELEVQPGLPPLLAEEGLIRSVVRNLIGNAIKFSHDGGRVQISVCEQDGNLTLSVEDEGMGIPEDAIPQLFTKFFRVPSPSSAQTRGTGLGLALAKEAVLAHGGHIAVESNLGKGSRFTVSFPKSSSLPSGSADPGVEPAI